MRCSPSGCSCLWNKERWGASVVARAVGLCTALHLSAYRSYDHFPRGCGEVCRIGLATGDSGEVLERRDPCHRNSGQKARVGLFLIQFGENYSLGNPPAIVNFELNYLILRDYCLFSVLSCFTAASTCSKSAVFVYAK